MAVDLAVVSEEVAAETSLDTWGLVGTWISHFENVTPAREMIGHCKLRWSSDDLLCYLQPQLHQGCLTASASFKETTAAACTLFLARVVDRGVGGLLVIPNSFYTSLHKMPKSSQP